jgi:phosphoinositide-3-kinase regulatory subunit 4
MDTGGKITSLAILENSHSVAAASSDGSIHVFRVEHAKKEKSNLFDYTGTTLIRTVDKLEGAVVKVEHFDKQASNQSLLLYATDAGIVHAWDLRSSKEPWSFQNKPHLGLISTMLVDPSRNWVAIGTNRGFVTCWDLRFKVCFREWRLPDQSVVHQFANLATSGPTSWSGESTTSLLAAAGPGDLAEWNIQSAQCKRMFRILGRFVNHHHHHHHS